MHLLQAVQIQQIKIEVSEIDPNLKSHIHSYGALMLTQLFLVVLCTVKLVAKFITQFCIQYQEGV